MKRRVCRGPAAIRSTCHNAAFCPAHFQEHVLRWITRAIDRYRMFAELRGLRLVAERCPLAGG